jgi:hypothetical protein
MAGLYIPLPTLHPRPYERRRTAWGRCGLLLLHRIGLAPTTGALRKTLDRPTVERSRVPAPIVVAERDEMMHTQLAHVAERHRRAGWVVGAHSMTSSARARNAGDRSRPSILAV